MAQFSLQWDEFKQSICNGLSSLQQNGELVDVTLAADGHLVRVHRLVLSLASPYLKEILNSAAECKHPVVFLNRVSYPVLCSILEYVYTGQAVVTRELLPELVQAAKELRIKGLDDVVFEFSSPAEESKTIQPTPTKTDQRTIKSPATPAPNYTINVEATNPERPHIKILNRHEKSSMPSLTESSYADPSDHHTFDDAMDTDTDTDWKCVKTDSVVPGPKTRPEYSFGVSIQGGLQIILNRYIYNCRYTSTKGADQGHRQWRCADYSRPKVCCKALVITQGDSIIKRTGMHNHPFHDKRILKKVQANAVYATLTDAETKTFESRRKRGDDTGAD